MLKSINMYIGIFYFLRIYLKIEKQKQIKHPGQSWHLSLRILFTFVNYKKKSFNFEMQKEKLFDGNLF